jgi:general secretion pathway protein G
VREKFTFWFLLAILGTVVFLAITPRIGHSGRQPRPNRAIADIRGGIRSALGQYKVDSSSYPKSLQDLVQKPDEATNWHGPYLDKLPVDPWGHKYIYDYPGKHNTNGYDLSSAGPDGKPGTDDDIGNWTR